MTGGSNQVFTIPSIIHVKSLNGCSAFNSDSVRVLYLKPINPFKPYLFSQVCPGSNLACSPGFFNHGFYKVVYEGFIQLPASCNEYEFIAYENLEPYTIWMANIFWIINLNDNHLSAYLNLNHSQQNTNANTNKHNLLPLFCKNTRVNYSFNTIDEDFDSIVYTLYNLKYPTNFIPTNGCPVCPQFPNSYSNYTYMSPLTYLHPTFDCGFKFNSVTGEYKFRADSIYKKITNGTFIYDITAMAIGMQINEYRTGQLIGTSQRIALFNVKESPNCGELSLDSAFSPSCKLVQSHAQVKDSFGCYNDTYISTKLVFCENAPIEINFKVKNLQKKVVKIENYSGQGILSDRDTTVRDSMRDFRISWANPKAGNHFSAIEFNHCPDTGIYNNKYSNYITSAF
ncbi:MAG: hypothetical protein IPK03_02525 [Bacteroidetes bacterium]|nr:hypothetical protein [Bacteroidota bacterium]